MSVLLAPAAEGYARTISAQLVRWKDPLIHDQRVCGEMLILAERDDGVETCEWSRER